MPLLSEPSDLLGRLQEDLFPGLRKTVGPLSDKMQLFITALEMSAVSDAILPCRGRPGRPEKDRVPLVRAFIAKAVFEIPTTLLLRERLLYDTTLRGLCGWYSSKSIPSESTFSRAFAEFADMQLPMRIHEKLIKRTHSGRLVGHISRDSTAIEAREAPAKIEAPKKWRRQKAPPKDHPDYARVRRLERQAHMTLTEMLADLPTHCAIGMKSNAKGFRTTWIGYKLHIDTADGNIPIAALLTSASLHDSQAAIPLATITSQRVTNLYEVMDSAYDAPEIAAFVQSKGCIPLIQKQVRRNKALKKAQETERRARMHANFKSPEDTRLNERSSAERINARLKDEFGGRTVRVRGHEKVACHLFFGLLVLTADQLMRFVT